MPSISGNDINAKAKSINLAHKVPTFLNGSTNVDWSLNTIFYDIIAANKTYTFSNVSEGLIVVLTVKNTSGSTITLTFPTLLGSSTTLNVLSNKENVYTFIRSNNKTYVTVLDGAS